MARYRDISTGIEQEFDFDPTGGNVYSQFQPVDATGKALNSASIMAEAAKRLENAPLPIPDANNGTALGGAGSFNINAPGGNQETGGAQPIDWGSILAQDNLESG